LTTVTQKLKEQETLRYKQCNEREWHLLIRHEEGKIKKAKSKPRKVTNEATNPKEG
jgi:hypothetical protein